ncbi:uncharacterized protein Nost [Fopius arisanus]|uniref:NOSTRIN_2 protein n=1 Tax=Fopius arisanus TaxID=64838 RepID=A0A0C9RXA3_9HYME|nr:PREDICTED: uncharacterized protein LOC105265800 [Fopius arisanus]XP_011301838.1 PREDICTED: uncharacterized protein LOC105265800 [Fopius arisanus]
MMNEVRQKWSSPRCTSAISPDNGEQKSTYNQAIESDFSEATNERPMESARSKFLGSLTCTSHPDHVGDTIASEEALYQNNASLVGEREVKNLSSSQSGQLSLHLDDDVAEVKRRRRHSSSVEITAMTSVKTDEDGLPVISFSFLQERHEIPQEFDRTDKLQLYDFPRSTRVSGVGEASDPEPSGPDHPSTELYDFPTSIRVVDPVVDQVPDDLETLKNSEELYEVPGINQENAKNSVSLTLEVDSRAEPRVEQMSYSDPEDNYCCRERGKKSRNRTLGRAWGRMRSWLKEEKLRIGEVVQRHARMQAVGALRTDPETSGSCGSYDLVEARTRELGPISVIDEAPLSSVSEEVNGDDVRTYDLVTSDVSPEIVPNKFQGRLRDKTTSVENVAGGKMKLTPVSFSLDKLCDEEEVNGKERNYGKGGVIRRRMLGSIRGFMASTNLLHQSDTDETGPGGFEDVRRYVKQGGDFCKELAAVLHERAELEANYAKGLSKLSSKLTKACAKDQGGNSSGGVNEAWRNVGEEMEAAAEAHRLWGIALSEQLAKPLRVGVAEAQGRSRKVIESSVDKASKSLQEWRNVAAKSKKQSFACARENERLQDLARIQSITHSQQNNNKTSTHHMTEKEVNKLENRRRKAEDGSRRADTEFYTVSVRAERARLEYESTVRKGAKQMELLEEERLSALKDLANVYLSHLQALAPRLQQSADRLSTPVRNCNVSLDVDILKNLIRRLDNNETPNVDQLLPDFYAEHVTLAMNRERRKQALVRVLHLIRQDLERERRGREGLETLHRAFIQTPAFAADESTQNVTDKLIHMRSMLTYLEAARYKVGGALAEIEGGKRPKHPLAEHILVSRDKQGLQQSVLKVPTWAKNESFESPEVEDDIDIHISKNEVERNDWDRTAGDGNSENPPDEEDFSDFDEFSSQSEDNNNQEDVGDLPVKIGGEQCRALYQYSANLNDELSLSPGDVITIHQKQADGWWIGECAGRTGIFPATYVQVLR